MPSRQISVERWGDWSGAVALPKKLTRLIESRSVAALNDWADTMNLDLRETIRTGKAMGPVLAPSTVARKGHSVPLSETDALAQAVTVVKATSKKPGMIGFKSRRHPGSTSSMAEIAAVHEFGNVRTPARPFIRPTVTNGLPKLQEAIGDVARKIINEVK